MPPSRFKSMILIRMLVLWAQVSDRLELFWGEKPAGNAFFGLRHQAIPILPGRRMVQPRGDVPLLVLPGDVSTVHGGPHLKLSLLGIASPPAEFSAHVDVEDEG